MIMICALQDFATFCGHLAVLSDMEVDNLITVYHCMGMQNMEICNCLLLQHGLTVSERTVKRRLNKLHLFRKMNYSDDTTVAAFIEETLQGAGGMHGYRWMYLKCLHHGFTVTQETVRQLMCLLDPEGVTFRKHRRLQRRSYYSGGPNAVWHIDGYDKLKKYGIAIHGCIDGFSRHIIWLHAYTTNNDPRVIAGYFVDAVESLGGCPRKIRSDRGTENVYVEQIQLFLREETQSYMYGTSINNQRIESWWAILRRQMMQFWINVFEKLKEEDLFCGSFLDKSLMQFCFLDLIQVCSCLLTLMPLLQYVCRLMRGGVSHMPVY